MVPQSYSADTTGTAAPQVASDFSSQWPTLQIQKGHFFFVRNDSCSDIHYETHVEHKYLSFRPYIDLSVLWLKDEIIVLLETILCPPASEYWRAMVAIV